MKKTDKELPGIIIIAALLTILNVVELIPVAVSIGLSALTFIMGVYLVFRMNNSSAEKYLFLPLAIILLYNPLSLYFFDLNSPQWLDIPLALGLFVFAATISNPPGN